jgi:hypothetical protein
MNADKLSENPPRSSPVQHSLVIALSDALLNNSFKRVFKAPVTKRTRHPWRSLNFIMEEPIYAFTLPFSETLLLLSSGSS